MNELLQAHQLVHSERRKILMGIKDSSLNHFDKLNSFGAQELNEYINDQHQNLLE